MAEATQVVLRAARGLDDARLLHVWRNEPTTRAASFSQELIPWREHLAWCARSEASPDREVFIIMGGDTPLGTVRLDRVAADAWEVGITLAPDARGQGLAVPALHAAAAHLRASEPTARRVIARIRSGNESSRRAFSRAGYQAVEEPPATEHTVMVLALAG